MTRRLRSSVLLVLVLMVLTTAGAGACAGSGTKGSVSLLGTETKQFEKLRKKFTDETGIEVSYRATRAQDQVLSADLQNGTPPDVAVLSSPGELAWYASRDYLKPLDNVEVVGPEELKEYSSQWQKLARAGLNRLYAIPVEVNLKSIAWFNKKSWRQPPTPKTLEQLMAQRSTWCMGLGSGAASGWPGTDWIEDILLHRFGKKVYEQWAAGELPWNAPEMMEAWTIWGKIATDPKQVHGGPTGVLLTSFGDAGRPMFDDSPSCFLEHQGSFAARGYQDYENKQKPDSKPKPNIDFDFIDFPNSGNAPPDDHSRSSMVAADMVVMFNDTPQAKQLVKFLASKEAQQLLPDERHFSAHTNVRPDAYPNKINQRIAEVLTGGETLCFDASDMMPATMRNAFYRATQEYLSDPGKLDELLKNLQKTQDELPKERWLKVSCGM